MPMNLPTNNIPNRYRYRKVFVPVPGRTSLIRVLSMLIGLNGISDVLPLLSDRENQWCEKYRTMGEVLECEIVGFLFCCGSRINK